MIASHWGRLSRRTASSLVNTVRPSVSMPRGTKGSEPVAISTSVALSTRSTPLLCRTATCCGPANWAVPRTMVTPARSKDLVRLARMFSTSWVA